ncbi:MAG: hypothetical protein J3Q66DRAFT_362824 [Benniella sp.]|nr:MAG: hypothetical protein J3Q66DRAFT_362824 [Benniella sp.]
MSELLALVSRTNVYKDAGKDLNIEVITKVAQYVSEILRTFSLDGTVSDPVGLAGAEGGVAGVSADNVALPYLQVLSTFRDTVRRYAREGRPAQELLAPSDKLRDEDLERLGVALDDQELAAARVAKAQQAAEKAAKKAEQAQAQAAACLAKLEKGRLSHVDMFSLASNADEYGSFEEGTGIPLTDKEGQELAKSRRKKLTKEWEAQKKLHEDFLAEKEKAEKRQEQQT